MKLTVAWYPVTDMAKGQHFYGEVLGLNRTYEMQGWAEYANSRDEASIGLSLAPAAGGDGGATAVLRVDNLDRTMSDLAKKGVAFDKVDEYPGIVRIATFRDPFNNRLQLVQVLMS